MSSLPLETPAFDFPDWLGKDLGDFKIEKLIARGGMAIVYQGLQKSLQRKVAIKILPPALSQRPEFNKLFIQEALVLANLSHPNIVPIYSYGQLEGCPYFAMELIHGETLREKIDHRKRSLFKGKTLFTLPDVLRWIRQVAAALEYAHTKGIVHRDIKPSNVIVDNHDRVFVTDFGLVKVYQLGLEKEMISMTPSYMSYEQAYGMNLDMRSDIYSLGCLMHELLIARPPCEATTIAQAREYFEQSPPSESKTGSMKIPLLLHQVLSKALARDKRDRYQTVSEFLAILDNFASGKLQARLDKKMEALKEVRKRKAADKPARTVMATLLFLLLCLVLFIFVKPWITRSQESRAQVESWCAGQWQVAENYRANDMKELAAQVYRSIIDRYPKHPTADKARSELKKLDEVY